MEYRGVEGSGFPEVTDLGLCRVIRIFNPNSGESHGQEHGKQNGSTLNPKARNQGYL